RVNHEYHKVNPWLHIPDGEGRSVEAGADHAVGALTVLAHVDVQVVALLSVVLQHPLSNVVLLAVQQHDDVRVLLDGATVTQVGEAGDVRLLLLHGAVQLLQGDDRDVEILRHHHQVGAHLGHAVVGTGVGTEAVVGEAEVVEDHQVDVAQPLGFVEHVGHGRAGRGVNVDGEVDHLLAHQPQVLVALRVQLRVAGWATADDERGGDACELGGGASGPGGGRQRRTRPECSMASSRHVVANLQGPGCLAPPGSRSHDHQRTGPDAAAQEPVHPGQGGGNE